MPKSTKIIILAALLGAISILYWTSLRNILFQPDGANAHFWSLTSITVFAVLSVVLATLYGLIAFVIVDGRWAYAVLGAGSLPFFAAIPNYSPPVLGAFFFFIAGLMFMRARIASENAGRIKMSVEKVLPQHLSTLFFTLPLLIAVVFYVSPAPGQIKDIRIPREVFQKMIRPVEIIFEQRAGAGFSSALGAISQNAGQVPEEAKKLYLPFVGEPQAPSPYSEFSDALYEAVNARIASLASLPPKTQQYVNLGLAVAIFFSVRILLIPLGWVVVLLCIMLWNILTYVGFVKIGTVQVEKEVIGL